MKYIKSVLACVLVATMVASVDGTVVKADEHVVGCNSQNEIVRCTGPMSSTGQSQAHILYTGVNGPVYCNIVTLNGIHDSYCSNCKVFLYTSIRTHVRYHDYCPDETGLCQY